MPDEIYDVAVVDALPDLVHEQAMVNGIEKGIGIGLYNPSVALIVIFPDAINAWQIAAATNAAISLIIMFYASYRYFAASFGLETAEDRDGLDAVDEKFLKHTALRPT